MSGSPTDGTTARPESIEEYLVRRAALDPWGAEEAYLLRGLRALLAERDALQHALRDHVAMCEQAALNWREVARRSRNENSKSWMCGEHGIPSHVLNTTWSLAWEAAAENARSVLASLSEETP